VVTAEITGTFPTFPARAAGYRVLSVIGVYDKAGNLIERTSTRAGQVVVGSTGCSKREQDTICAAVACPSCKNPSGGSVVYAYDPAYVAPHPPPDRDGPQIASHREGAPPGDLARSPDSLVAADPHSPAPDAHPACPARAGRPPGCGPAARDPHRRLPLAHPVRR